MNIMEEKLQCIKPENPCIEWYVIYDELFDKFWFGKSDVKILQEVAEKGCKNCTLVRTCRPMKLGKNEY